MSFSSEAGYTINNPLTQGNGGKIDSCCPSAPFRVDLIYTVAFSARPAQALTLTKSKTLLVSVALIALLLALAFVMRTLPFKDTSPFERTHTASPSSVSIIAFGDQGSGDYRQRRVAALLESACRATPDLAFIQTLGDNFYFKGVKSLKDPLWHKALQSIYNTPCLVNTPFHAILGNHDEEGDPAVQIAYTSHDPGPVKWFMPDYTYVSHAGTAADGRPLVTIVSIDTSMPMKDQIALIDKTFAKPANSVWRIVAGHHNVRTDSAKYHGKEHLRGELLPALERNHVDFYLSGHSHNLQLIEHRGEPVYVIAGGGGKHPRPVLTNTNNKALLARQSLGFAKLSFSPKSASIDFTATSGNLFSTFAVEHYRYTVSRACLDTPDHNHCVKPATRS